MAELFAIEKSQKKLSFAKDKIFLAATAVFIVSAEFLTDIFEGTLKKTSFVFILILLYKIVQQFLDESIDQPFDFKNFLKKLFFYGVALAISSYLFDLTNSFSAGFSNAIISKLLSVLLGWVILFLFIIVIQFIEKPSKK